jgi:hypothetical protein
VAAGRVPCPPGVSPCRLHLLRMLAPLRVDVHVAAELGGVQHLAQLQAGKAGERGALEWWRQARVEQGEQEAAYGSGCGAG